MSDVEIREIGSSDEELEPYVEQCLRFQPSIWDLTVQDLRWWEGIAGPQLRLVLVAPDGSDVGIASATGEPGDLPNIHGWICVHSDWTGRGLGTEVLARIEAWAAEQRTEPALRIGVDVSQPDVLGWWERRGFREIDRFVITQREIDPTETITLREVGGVEFTDIGARPDLLRPAYDASREFRRDLPGEYHEPLPYEEFVAFIDRGERPADSIVVALADERIVGLCTLQLTSDRRRAHTGFTGVAADWRGRGLAGALKDRQLEWCRLGGIHAIRTTNHDDNAAMRAVNERAGFRPAHEQVALARSGRPAHE